MPLIHSAPRGRMNRMLRMKTKMADGEMSAADSNTSLPEKKSGYSFGHNETLFLISLYQKYEVFFSDVSYKKRAIWQMIADDIKKNGYSPSAVNCENRWKCLTSLFQAFFLCRQSDLFLAFRTNHSYSRIVDKKTRPKFRTLSSKTLPSTYLDMEEFLGALFYTPGVFQFASYSCYL